MLNKEAVVDKEVVVDIDVVVDVEIVASRSSYKRAAKHGYLITLLVDNAWPELETASGR